MRLLSLILNLILASACCFFFLTHCTQNLRKQKQSYCWAHFSGEDVISEGIEGFDFEGDCLRIWGFYVQFWEVFFLVTFEGRATHWSLYFFLYVLTWIPGEINSRGRKISWKCHIIPYFFWNVHEDFPSDTNFVCCCFSWGKIRWKHNVIVIQKGKLPIMQVKSRLKYAGI